MSKFAPVCPIHIYEGLREHELKTGDPVLGDYFLLLAHDVLANKERYEAFFKGKGYTIIMDNSVIELGSACTAEALQEAADTVGATCIAIPDVLENARETIKSAALFVDGYKGSTPLMFIPQGEDLYSWIKCLYTYARSGFPFEWVGIPRNTVPRIVSTRKVLVDIVRVMCPGAKIHLLGFSGDIRDDLETAEECAVEGIDSAVPLRQIFDITKRPIMDWPRGDWWEKCEYTELMAWNTLVVRKWIKELA